VTTALYRRYRPETFGEMIGQAQVTDPLMTALRGDRVGTPTCSAVRAAAARRRRRASSRAA
jgi:hypothetical protein